MFFANNVSLKNTWYNLRGPIYHEMNRKNLLLQKVVTTIEKINLQVNSY